MEVDADVSRAQFHPCRAVGINFSLQIQISEQGEVIALGELIFGAFYCIVGWKHGIAERSCCVKVLDCEQILLLSTPGCQAGSFLGTIQPVQPHEILIRNLRLLRTRHDLTQESTAELCGMQCKLYQQIETGRRPRLRLDTVDRLAKPFSLGVGEILLPTLPKSKINSRKKVRTRLRAVKGSGRKTIE